MAPCSRAYSPALVRSCGRRPVCRGRSRRVRTLPDLPRPAGGLRPTRRPRVRLRHDLQRQRERRRQHRPAPWCRRGRRRRRHRGARCHRGAAVPAVHGHRHLGPDRRRRRASGTRQRDRDRAVRDRCGRQRPRRLPARRGIPLDQSVLGGHRPGVPRAAADHRRRLHGHPVRDSLQRDGAVLLPAGGVDLRRSDVLRTAARAVRRHRRSARPAVRAGARVRSPHPADHRDHAAVPEQRHG